MAPVWGEFRLDKLNPAALPYCNVADVVADAGGAKDFVFRFFGTKRSQIQGRDYTGCSVSEFMPRHIGEKIVNEFEIVINEHRPILVITEARTLTGEFLRYDFLRLPLSADGMVVDKILSYSSDDKPLRILQQEQGIDTYDYPGTY